MAHIHMENNILFENAMAPAARTRVGQHAGGRVLRRRQLSPARVQRPAWPVRHRQTGNGRAEAGMRVPNRLPRYTVRRSGPPKVMLAIHGAMAPRALHVLAAQRARVEAPHQVGAGLGVAVVQQQTHVALGRERDKPVHHDQRGPQIAVRVERDAVGQAAQVGGAEDLAVDQPDFAWPGPSAACG